MSEELKYLAGLEASKNIENIDDYQTGYHNGYMTAKRKFQGKLEKEVQAEKNRERDLCEFYPFNVIYEAYSDVKGFNLYKENISYKSILDYFDKCLEARERDIIELVYKHKKSLAFCGERFGITRERARQIKEKVIERIKGPGQLELLEVVSRHDYLDAKDEVEKLKIYITKDRILALSAKKIGELPIGIRCKNALVRAGIVDTRDLETLTLAQVKLISSFGEKCINELSNALRKLGYTVNESNPHDYYIRIE